MWTILLVPLIAWAIPKPVPTISIPIIIHHQDIDWEAIRYYRDFQ